MEIRLTTTDDLEEVMKIYEHARAFMREHDNPRQWSAYGWPPQSVIEADIQHGKSYVAVENGEIAAVFYYDHGVCPEPAYNDITDGLSASAGHVKKADISGWIRMATIMSCRTA